MSLLDGQATIYGLENIKSYDELEQCILDAFNAGYSCGLDLIDRLVKCSECRQSTYIVYDGERTLICKLYGMHTKEDDFCSRGEKVETINNV